MNIDIHNHFNIQRTDIKTNSREGTGGDIKIVAKDISLIRNSDIITFSALGDGGDIYLRADSIIAFDDSDILATSFLETGGNITLDTPAFFASKYEPTQSKNFDIDLQSSGNEIGRELGQEIGLQDNNQANVSATGRINSGAVSSPDTNFIQNSLADLPNNAIDTENLLANSCIARTENGGAFLITGTGGLRSDRPGSAPLSPYPTDTVRSAPDAGWQPGDPIIEPQGVYRLPNGNLVMMHECQH